MPIFRWLIAFVCSLFLIFLFISGQVFSQTYTPATPPNIQFFTSAGAVCNACKLYTYTAGTSSLLSTYSNSTGTANANPVVLDSAGRGTVYLSSSANYKFILKTSADVTIWTQDNIQPLAPASGVTGSIVGTTATQTLTNKTLGNTNTVTLKDTLFTLQDNTTTTKQLQFELSGITAATTRTFTAPDANIQLGEYAISCHAQAATAMVDQSCFVATQAYQITAIRFVHAVAETTAGSLDIQVTKDTSTNAPGAGTDLLTNNSNAGFDGRATANTVQTGTLTATTANLQLAAGDRISLDFEAAATELVGVTITIVLKRI